MTGWDIVVTGCGLVGSFGSHEQAFVEVLREGRACAGPCTLFESPYPVAQARDFRLAEHVRNPRAERSPRISQFALAAAAQAIRQSGIDAKAIGSDDTAIVYGTGSGPASSSERSLEAICTRGLAAVEPLVFQESVFNAPPSAVSIQFGIKGPAVVLPLSFGAGLHALKQACDLLRLGTVERVLLLAADEFAPVMQQAYYQLGIIDPDAGGDGHGTSHSPRMRGTVLGEGAVALMLERKDQAMARGGLPRARIAGCAVGGDARGPVAPDGSGAALDRVMRRALEQAGRAPGGIGQILAGSLANSRSQREEGNGLRTLFDDRELPCPVTSLKPLIGETLGSAGLFGLVAGILAVEQGGLPGVPAAAMPVRTALVNSLSTSGSYATAVVEATA